MLSPGSASTPFVGGDDVRTSDDIRISVVGALLRRKMLPPVARIGMEDEVAIRSAG
jgi:hypothetical protein